MSLTISTRRLRPIDRGSLLLLGTWSNFVTFRGPCCSALNLYFVWWVFEMNDNFVIVLLLFINYLTSNWIMACSFADYVGVGSQVISTKLLTDDNIVSNYINSVWNRRWWRDRNRKSGEDFGGRQILQKF